MDLKCTGKESRSLLNEFKLSEMFNAILCTISDFGLQVCVCVYGSTLVRFILLVFLSPMVTVLQLFTQALHE